MLSTKTTNRPSDSFGFGLQVHPAGQLNWPIPIHYVHVSGLSFAVAYKSAVTSQHTCALWMFSYKNEKKKNVGPIMMHSNIGKWMVIFEWVFSHIYAVCSDSMWLTWPTWPHDMLASMIWLQTTWRQGSRFILHNNSRGDQLWMKCVWPSGRIISSR